MRLFSILKDEDGNKIKTRNSAWLCTVESSRVSSLQLLFLWSASVNEQRRAVHMPFGERGGRKERITSLDATKQSDGKEGRGLVPVYGHTHSHRVSLGWGLQNGKKTPIPALYFTLHCFSFFLPPSSLLFITPFFHHSSSFSFFSSFLILNSYPLSRPSSFFLFFFYHIQLLIMDVVPDVDHPPVYDNVEPDVIDSPSSPTKKVQTPTILSRLHLIDEEQKFRYALSSFLTCKQGLFFFSLPLFFLLFRLTRMHLFLLKQT